MTNDKDCDDAFQVVLIDLQKAAKSEIYCVKKALTEELKYVAISYRWGELHETNVDTRAGYVASITSFGLKDFYRLCAAMTKEPDLRSMDYVWVDTICVNQANHDERKATIYHMSEIYEHATWILAVPDLHAAHLRTMANHKKVMESVQQHQSYLYHLLHRNIKELHSQDATFLDSIGVPQDPDLRQLLTKYTKCFADGFTRISQRYRKSNDVYIISHLFDNHQHSFTNDDAGTKDSWEFLEARRMDEIQPLHQCNDGDNCPFKTRRYEYDRHQINGGWHISIIERSKLICQAMYFLKDLVVDWSSRVWVISEFHIAKKKNNLKFWFTQLNNHKADLTFFKFKVNNPRLTYIQERKPEFALYTSRYWELHTVYYVFYLTFANQLNKQTFVEMMLKSKASKNEDRFHSIFPLFPEYKDLLHKTRNDLVNNASSILTVKLKLYEVMTNEHKKSLLCSSARGEVTYILPTFATTSIDFYALNYKFCSDGFGDADIALFYETTIDNRSLYYLKVKPNSYRTIQAELCTDSAAGRALTQLLHIKRKTLCLETDVADKFNVDMINIGSYANVILIGSFNENIWLLSNRGDWEATSETKYTYNYRNDFYSFCVY